MKTCVNNYIVELDNEPDFFGRWWVTFYPVNDWENGIDYFRKSKYEAIKLYNELIKALEKE